MLTTRTFNVVIDADTGATPGSNRVVTYDSTTGRLRYANSFPSTTILQTPTPTGVTGIGATAMTGSTMTLVQGTLTSGQVISPLITATTGYHLSLDTSGATGTNVISSSILNSTTAVGASVVISATTALLQRSTSSIRYKTDVEDIEPTYTDNVWKMRPVWYRSTCPADRHDWSYYGFIAEEVAAIDPRLCFWRGGEAPPNPPLLLDSMNQGGEGNVDVVEDAGGQSTSQEPVKHESSQEVSVAERDASHVESVMYDRIMPLLVKAQKDKNAQLRARLERLREMIRGTKSDVSPQV